VKGKSAAQRRTELGAFLVARRAGVNAKTENLYEQNQYLMITVQYYLSKAYAFGME
jgi:hypothetical protein